MRKLFLGGLLFASSLFYSPKAHAIQFALPYITQQSTTSTNASIVFSTAGFPSTNYMNCLQHYTVESTLNGPFLITGATSTLTAATTYYSVVLSSGVPFNMDYGALTAYCTPPNTIMTLKVTSGNYTISAEQFVSQGTSP